MVIGGVEERAAGLPEIVLSLISEYGQIVDEERPSVERREQVVALLAEMLRLESVPVMFPGSVGDPDVSRLACVVGGQRYLVEVLWPDQDVSAEMVGRLLSPVVPGSAGARRALWCLPGIEDDAVRIPPGATEFVLLDQAHLEALVCGLFTLPELFDRSFGAAFLAGQPYVSLTEMLVEQPSEVPARMLRRDQLAPPWPVVQETGLGVDADVVLVSDAGWRQPLGMAAGSGDTLLVTTDEGVLELDARRGATFWAVRLPDCAGRPLPQPDGSFLVLCRGVVLRCRQGSVEPVAGGFDSSATLIAGDAGEPWVLSGTGATAEDSVALTWVGERAGQQHRFDVHFDAAVRAAGWLDRRRFFLAAGGHSAVVDLARSTAVCEVDWLPISQHYRGGLLVVDPNTVLTAAPTGSGITVEFSLSIIADGATEVAATLAINAIYGVSLMDDGRVYVLADVRGNDPQPRPILIRLSGVVRAVPDPSPPLAASAPITVHTVPAGSGPASAIPGVADGPAPGSTVTPAAPPPDPYQAIRDTASGRRRDYSLDPRPIEHGGQAEVFAATHKPTTTRVAVKKLRARNNDAVARMRREIDFAQQLGNHPHVMPILDHSSTHDWFVMPLADGTAETLLLDDLTDPTNVQEMVLAVCSALGAAHDHGWIHRDIKPANLLKLAGRWVLSDWGLVRRPRGQTTDAHRTRSGVALGTDGFAAPELLASPHHAGPQADIYSVGQLIGWALCSEWPQPNIPLLPPDGPWREIVQAATLHDPIHRPATIAEFLALINYHQHEAPASVDEPR